MGNLTGGQNAAVEEADIASTSYKYPNKSGNYFGSHFIMGGERFDTPQPESYLFGENADLNFLGSRPTAFPYPPPQANEPTKTLKSLVNIRKESVRFVKVPENVLKTGSDNVTSNKGNLMNIEFTFDADIKCAITIYYFCTEDITSNGISFSTKDSALTSETYHYKRGVNQLFSQNMHFFNPSLYDDDDLTYFSERDIYPIAIHCVAEDETKQSHTTICVIDHHTDGTYVLRALKQKIFVDGLCYLLQEIYGIENKNINKTTVDEETDDNGSECVICMCDKRDTLILPCRHLCLCYSCADSLRYQANNCPICRVPFRALLQIRAVQKSPTTSGHTITNSTNTNLLSPSSPDTNSDNIPPGYIPVSLIEALNGPPQVTTRHSHVTDGNNGSNNIEQGTGDLTDAVQAAEQLNRSVDKSVNNKDQDKNSKDKINSGAPEIRMSVLNSKEDNGNKHNLTIANNLRDKSPRIPKVSKLQQNRDNVKIINEKNALNMKSHDLADDDSDAEKLSPLLEQKIKFTKEPEKNNMENSALRMEGVDESIDDTDTDLEDHENEKRKVRINNNDTENIVPGAEDSDYYTPEDPHTTILSPLCPEKKTLEALKSKENLSNAPSPLSTIKEHINSLPDSPISGNSASTRSSGNSYSSSSSTKQLLSSVPTVDIKICDEKQHSGDKSVAV